MTRDEFNTFCQTLPATTNVVQWGGASVWKVGGKIFALCSDWSTHNDCFSFKCSDMAYDILKEQQGMRPSPYLHRAKWIQVFEKDAMTEDDLKSHILNAHTLIARKLTKAVKKELELTDYLEQIAGLRKTE